MRRMTIPLYRRKLLGVEHRLRSRPPFQAAVRAPEQGERQRAVKRKPPSIKPVRFGAGALAHRFGYPSLAALATSGEFLPLGASPLDPFAPALDHRRDDAGLALRGPRTRRSAAMHPATSVLHRPAFAIEAARDPDAVLADPEQVLHPRVTALTARRSPARRLADPEGSNTAGG